MEPERASATCAGPGASTSVAASAPPHGASMPTLSVFEAQKLLHLAAVAKQLGLLSGECSANGNAAGKTVRKGVVSPACDPQAPTFDDIPDTMAVAAEVVPARQPLNPLVRSQRLSDGLLFQDGGHARQVRQVSAEPAQSLKPPTSPHG